MANLINSTVPKLKVDNSQAMSAIKAVINEIAKVKDKTVTITTIRKTKNVSAAKGFEGLITSPTNFTVGEGAKPEWVSVTPMSGSSMVNRTETINNRTSRPISNNYPIIVNNQVFLDGVELRHILSHQLSKNQSAFK
jgi:hypothetical protein